MDDSKIVGGDNLLAKINEGIRAAKVVVCCVTSKYSASENCDREVSRLHEGYCLFQPSKPYSTLLASCQLVANLGWPTSSNMQVGGRTCCQHDHDQSLHVTFLTYLCTFVLVIYICYTCVMTSLQLRPFILIFLV